MPRPPEISAPAPASRPRSVSRVVAYSPGSAPLKDAYDRAKALTPRTWSEIEELFLRGMEGFDENVATGRANMGDLQNGKGDFFNDLLALLLENCAQVQLYSRGGVPGLLIPKHNLDVTYPHTGAIEFVLEAKAVGTPKHPGSPRAKAIGRAGSADLDKRVKEIGFKAIDLKAEYARMLAAEGHSPNVISGDLTTWLKSVKPRSYVFFAARVISDNDRDRVVQFANVAGQVSDAVGVYCFRPVSPVQPTRYRKEKVPSHIELDRVLFRACQDLTAIRSAAPVTPTTLSPAVVADSIPIDDESSAGA
jgi:hypothetical protein